MLHSGHTQSRAMLSVGTTTRRKHLNACVREIVISQHPHCVLEVLNVVQDDQHHAAIAQTIALVAKLPTARDAGRKIIPARDPY